MSKTDFIIKNNKITYKLITVSSEQGDPLIIKSFVVKFEKNFKKQYNHDCGVVIYNNEEFTFVFPLEPNRKYSKEDLLSLEKNVFDLLKSADFTDMAFLEKSESYVIIKDEIPDNFQIDCDIILLNFNDVPNNSISLKSIHKKINCERLHIYNPEAIKSHVLGLLKIKNLQQIYCADLDPESWINIIKKYLAGNKSVWHCQDELQDLDLDEYAQL